MFWVFYGKDYYANGGVLDFLCTFESLEMVDACLPLPPVPDRGAPYFTGKVDWAHAVEVTPTGPKIVRVLTVLDDGTQQWRLPTDEEEMPDDEGK